MVDLKALGGPLYKTDIISTDFTFTVSDSEEDTIEIGKELRELVQGRLFINDSYGGGAFAAWVTLTFYNKAAMRGEDAFYRTEAKLVYTELEAATAVGSPNVKPDDHTDFSPSDLAMIQGTSDELVRLMTIADTMIAEDNILAIHAINTPLVRVVEFSGFSLFNLESLTEIHAKLDFAATQSVNLTLELTVGK